MNGPNAQPQHFSSAAVHDYHKIGTHTFEAFIDMATLFHNYPAPGLLIGGYMTATAMSHMSEGTLYEAISETSWCLPDAIQMLTPCTSGNGWMHVYDFGVYALSLYDKYTGKGVRVWLDLDKIDPDSEIRTWYLKLKPKKDQDSPLLRHEIGMAGSAILSVTPIQVREDLLGKRTKGSIAVCPLCKEAYPIVHGSVCRSCAGQSPYTPSASSQETILYPLPRNLHTLPTEEAHGQQIVHDMTRIEPGKSKGAVFHKGDHFDIGDLCRLQKMGRNHVYVAEGEAGEEWVHENECAKAFAKAMAGQGVLCHGEPSEGKMTLRAAHDGLLRVKGEELYAFNSCQGVMAASRKGWTLVKQGEEIAGTRAIPLYLERSLFTKACQTLEQGPIFDVLPMLKASTGVLITGDEVYNGTIEDRFEGIIQKKLSELGCIHHKTIFVPDKREAIRDAAQTLVNEGCDLIITTAGLSVDPGDVTRHGLVDAGARDLLYGIPILPGAMTLIGKIGNACLLGVPACALFFKRTSMDLLLPRLLADVAITRDDLARMGEGGLCLTCETCHFPRCTFGK
ncbi:MAG: trehalose-binding protein [Deltaproteobacteria bacterium]|nr:MAG: trehalose-binding protein [Deltaproteobacteria bacterium]